MGEESIIMFTLNLSSKSVPYVQFIAAYVAHSKKIMAASAVALYGLGKKAKLTIHIVT
jgi:predicted transcriptional regulator of viral defense system